MQEHGDPIGWVGNWIGLVGGLAGIGTAIAAALIAIWRNGYNAGRQVERNRQQSELMQRLANDRE